jgi:hypothetical protein
MYNFLPFGLNSAVHCITKIFKPILHYVHFLGIPRTIYVDDGRILSPSAEIAQYRGLIVYDVLRQAGWHLEVDKSDRENESSCLKKYLGFKIDTISMMVTAPLEKITDILAFYLPLLDKSVIKIKDLAKILGRIVSLIPSHRTLARICT